MCEFLGAGVGSISSQHALLDEVVLVDSSGKWTTSEYNLALGQLSIQFLRKDGLLSDHRTPSTLIKVLGNDFGMCFQMYSDESMLGDFFVNRYNIEAKAII